MINVLEGIFLTTFLTKDKEVVAKIESYNYVTGCLTATLKSGKKAKISKEDISLYQNNNYMVTKLLGKEVKTVFKGYDNNDIAMLSRRDIMIRSVQKHKKGDTVLGTVVSASDKALYIEFSEGLSGIIYMNQLTSAKINRPNDLFEVGNKVQAKIIKYNENTHFFELSRLELYKGVGFKNRIGDVVDCRITKILNDKSGCFVELMSNPCISGIFDIKEGCEFKIGSNIKLRIHKMENGKLRLRTI